MKNRERAFCDHFLIIKIQISTSSFCGFGPPKLVSKRYLLAFLLKSYFLILNPLTKLWKITLGPWIWKKVIIRFWALNYTCFEIILSLCNFEIFHQMFNIWRLKVHGFEPFFGFWSVLRQIIVLLLSVDVIHGRFIEQIHIHFLHKFILLHLIINNNWRLKAFFSISIHIDFVIFNSSFPFFCLCQN